MPFGLSTLYRPSSGTLGCSTSSTTYDVPLEPEAIRRANRESQHDHRSLSKCGVCARSHVHKPRISCLPFLVTGRAIASPIAALRLPLVALDTIENGKLVFDLLLFGQDTGLESRLLPCPVPPIPCNSFDKLHSARCYPSPQAFHFPCYSCLPCSTLLRPFRVQFDVPAISRD
jgi:hypothetical protein